MSTQRRKYPTDLTDGQWRLVAPLLPPTKPTGHNRRYSLREILNGIAYVLRTGCAWRHMPHDLPQWKAAYGYLRLWRSDGTWDRINTVVRIEAQTPPHNHPYPRKGPRHDGQASQTKQA